MAEQLGIAQQTYVRYETGIRRIPASMLPKQARNPGLTLEERMGVGSGPRYKPGPSSKLELPRWSPLHPSRRIAPSTRARALRRAWAVLSGSGGSARPTGVLAARPVLQRSGRDACVPAGLAEGESGGATGHQGRATILERVGWVGAPHGRPRCEARAAAQRRRGPCRG